MDTSTPANGYQLVHTTPAYTAASVSIPLAAVTATTAGIKYCSDTKIKQKLIVTLAAGTLLTDFGTGPDIGITLTTTPLIYANPGTTTGSKFYVESLNACVVATEFPLDVNRYITTTNTNTVITFSSIGSNVIYRRYYSSLTHLCFQCLQQGTTATSTFSIGDLYVLNSSAGYAGNDAFDFYGVLYSSLPPTPTSYFGVNSYTISRTGSLCTTTSLTNVNVALSNF